MLDRNTIIKGAFYSVGESFLSYNDNRENINQIANDLLTFVDVRVQRNNAFMFNATKTKFPLYKEEGGRYFYSIPQNFISIVKTSSPVDVVGEFISSEDGDLELYYKRKITFGEVPDYMEEYYIIALALELSKAISTYKSYYDMLLNDLNKVKHSISNFEGLVGDFSG